MTKSPARETLRRARRWRECARHGWGGQSGTAPAFSLGGKADLVTAAGGFRQRPRRRRTIRLPVPSRRRGLKAVRGKGLENIPDRPAAEAMLREGGE